MNTSGFLTGKGRTLAATLFVIAYACSTANAQGISTVVGLSCVTPLGGGPLAFAPSETVKTVWKSNTAQNICVTVSANNVASFSFVIGPGGLSGSVTGQAVGTTPPIFFGDSKTVCSLNGTATQVNVSTAAGAAVRSASYVICKN